jgi:hypothetical protein
MSILNNVPAAFRGPIMGNADAIISAVVPQYADGASVDDVVHFISGAIRHQARIAINKDGQPLGEGKSNTFKAVIDRVEIFERRGDQNFLVGKKAKIHLKAKNAGGDTEDQSIDTEWIEYHAGRREDEVFGIALANTIVKVAEANKGKEVFVSKGFITGVTTSKGGSSVRFCANIVPANGATGGGEDAGSRSNSSSGSSSSSSNSKPLASKDEIADFIEDIKDDRDANKLFGKLDDKQQREIPRVVLSGLAAGNPVAYISKALETLEIEISRDEIADIIDGKSKEKDFDLFFLISEAV